MKHSITYRVLPFHIKIPMRLLIKNSLYTLFFSIFLILSTSHSVMAFEFDEKMFTDLGETNIDLSQFSGPTNQFNGLYYADIYVNDTLTHQNQRIELATIDQEISFCFTQNILDELPLKQRDLKFSNTRKDNCPILTTDDPDIKINFSGHNNELHLAFPHKYIENIDTSWAPVSARDHGVAGIIFDYSLISSHDRHKRYGAYTSNKNLSSYGTVGANFGRFRVRADYQYSRKDSEGHFEWDKIYAFTDIGSLNSKLYVGELYTKSNLFDTFRFKGISLFSDEQMKPSYLRGYAPEITGLANSNAIVTLRQYGSVIRTIQVPPGPFSITDLPSGFSGPVDVTVEEDNGQTQRYQVDIANVPFLTRKGDIRYAANIGRISPLNNNKNSDYGNALSFDSSIGLTNTFSLLEGIMLTSNGKYQSYNLGLGMNLGLFGALSFDITHSKNSAYEKESFHGERYRINYSKRFFRYSTLSLSAVHSTDGYTTMQNYIYLKQNQTTRNINREKNRFTLSLSQNIPSISSSISLSISKNSYWEKNSSEYYNASFNKHFRTGYLDGSSITFSYSRNDTGYYHDKENRFALYVTIPLGKNSRNRLHYNSSYSDLSRQQSHDLTYYNYYNKNNYSDYLTVGTRAYRRPDYSGGNEYSLNASIDSTSRYGRLYATAEYAKDYQRATLGLDSSITITQHGIATNPRVYNDSARIIIDGGVSGVHIENSSATNIFGLAGIHNVSAYYPLTYKIDNDNLPQEVEIQNSVFKLAVSDGAIAYRSTNPITGEKAIVKITLANGDHPPFGSMVYRSDNFEREISMVSEEGMTYLSGIKKHARYQLKWGSENSCQFTIKQSDPESLNNIICQ